jgi:hypothetical protein
MPVGIFPNSLKKLTAIYSKGGEGDTHPELPGEGEREAEGWGKREFPGSTHEGLLIIPAVQVDPAQRQYWSTGSKR